MQAASLDIMPSFNVDTELALLGAMIVDPSAIDIASARLVVNDFYMSAHGKAFEHLVTLRESDKPTDDPIFVFDYLIGIGVCGSEATMIRPEQVQKAIDDAVPHNVIDYCTQIRQAAQQRELIEVMNRLSSKLQNQEVLPGDIAGWLTLQAEKIIQRESVNTLTLAQHVANTSERLHESMKRQVAFGFGTGLDAIDSRIGGLVPGELIIIAARPSNGKTSFAQQIVEHNAARGRRSLFVSLEMSGQDIAQRRMCALAGINQKVIRSGSLTPDQLLELQLKGEQIEGADIIDIFDEGKLSVRQIRALAKNMQSRGGLHLITVDYMDLVKPTNRMAPRNEQIGDTAQELKDLAKELHVPMVVLCQLNRKASEERPHTSHIRESGRIEQIADIIMLIHNPPEREDPNDHKAEIIIGKARNAETSSIEVVWNKQATTFYPL